MECGKILVVGGGVGGMSLAISLRNLGIEVDLIDIDPTWRAAGAGLTLNGATLRAFATLGVLEEVRKAGHIHGGRRVHSSDGTVIFDDPAFVPDENDLMAGGGILRPALHGILSAHTKATGTRLTLGVTVETIRDDGTKVHVSFSDGREDDYDLVVGADGIMSQTRGMIMPDASKPQFTGQGCWRAVFRRPADVATSHLYVDPGCKLGLNPVSHDHMYMFLLESAPGNPWRAQEHWIDELRIRLLGYGGLPHELAGELSEDSLVNYRPLETLLLSPPWNVGRVVLLGDAAHATTPHAGYGAGLSIEDGIVLAECLAEARAMEKALNTYSGRRYPRCKAVLQNSLALGEMEMAQAPIASQLTASAELFALTREPVG